MSLTDFFHMNGLYSHKDVDLFGVVTTILAQGDTDICVSAVENRRVKMAVLSLVDRNHPDYLKWVDDDYGDGEVRAVMVYRNRLLKEFKLPDPRVPRSPPYVWLPPTSRGALPDPTRLSYFDPASKYLSVDLDRTGCSGVFVHVWDQRWLPESVQVSRMYDE